MRVEHANPFISAVNNLFSTMLDAESKRSKIALSFQRGTPCEVSAAITISGKAHGVALLSFPKATALRAAGRFACQKFKRINDGVIDAIGEMVNIVAGGAKASLAEYELSISLPEVLRGIGRPVKFPPGCQPIQIWFDSEFGRFCLLVGLSEGDLADEPLSEIDDLGDPEIDERRSHRRFGLRQTIQVTFLHPGRPPKSVSADALEVSEGGVSFIHRDMLPAGVPCVLEMLAENGRRFTVRAKTVRSEYLNNMMHLVAVAFDAPLDLGMLFAHHEEAFDC